MSVTPRLILTATAAGTLLCGLCFVPSAHAGEDPAPTHRQAAASVQRVAHSATEESRQRGLPATDGARTTHSPRSLPDPR